MHPIVRLVLAAILLALLPSRPASAQGSAVSIPVVARHAGGKASLVSVAIGGGAPSLVSVDTGSVGLYVFQRQIGPEVRLTDAPIHQAYADGTNFRGVIGIARVRFADADGVAETRPMAIGVITDVSCAATKPDCPGSDRKPGIMGIGTDTGGRLSSPLAQLDHGGGDGFLLDLRRADPGRLVVDPSPDMLRGFRFVSLKPGRPTTIGLPSWDWGSVTGSFSVDGKVSPDQAIIFDTGEFDAVFDPGAVDGMRLGPHGFLLPGQLFGIDIPGALALRIPTDRSMFIKPKPAHRANTGSLPFRYVAIAFDAKRGRIGFSP